MTQLSCSSCEKPLTEIDFNGHRIWLCLNLPCRLYRQHQWILVQVGRRDLTTTKKVNLRSQQPSYPKWLEQRKPKRRERYHAIRKLGVGTKEALRFRDMTSMTIEDIAELSQKTRGILNDN